MLVIDDDHRRTSIDGEDLGPHHRARGLGRWIYCKYCYKHVLPHLGGINQVVCSECGYGLTPDFFNFENLLAWLNGEDKTKEDLGSAAAKRFLAAMKERKE